MSNFQKFLSLDREQMTEAEKELYVNDLTRLTQEYFEIDEIPKVSVVRSDGGFAVTVKISARRIKYVKRPV